MEGSVENPNILLWNQGIFWDPLLTSFITVIFFSTHFKMLHIYSFKPCWKNIFLQNFLHTRRSTIIMTVCDEQVLWNKHDWVSDLAWRYHVYYIHKVISKDPDTVKETQEEREQWPWCVICMGQGPCLPSLADSPINKQFHFSTTTIRLFNNCNFCDWQFCFWLMYKNKLPILMQFGHSMFDKPHRVERKMKSMKRGKIVFILFLILLYFR